MVEAVVAPGEAEGEGASLVAEEKEEDVAAAKEEESATVEGVEEVALAVLAAKAKEARGEGREAVVMARERVVLTAAVVTEAAVMGRRVLSPSVQLQRRAQGTSSPM